MTPSLRAAALIAFGSGSITAKRHTRCQQILRQQEHSGRRAIVCFVRVEHTPLDGGIVVVTVYAEIYVTVGRMIGSDIVGCCGRVDDYACAKLYCRFQLQRQCTFFLNIVIRQRTHIDKLGSFENQFLQIGGNPRFALNFLLDIVNAVVRLNLKR